jgi:protein-S-isoprenylcysteine O-methyltransferase Ste14
MVETLTTYPFILAIAAATLAEISAILIRRVAEILGMWLYWVAGVLSTVAAGCLVWSYLWARSLSEAAQPAHTLLAVLGAGLILFGGLLLGWSSLALGIQALIVLPRASLVRHGPYRHLRRPMGAAALLLGVGAALALNAGTLWVWTVSWFLLSLPVFELEEWELRARLAGAEAYLERTPRFIPRRRAS